MVTKPMNGSQTLPASRPYRFGRLLVDPSSRQVLVDGQSAAIGARAFDVLLALVTHSDRVLPKGELLDLVWPGVVVEENNLQVQISTLRKALGSRAIATIPGRGYRFIAAAFDDANVAASSPVPVEVRRTNLPRSLPALLGRDQDLSRLMAMLGAHGLVSLIGAGGVGKTLLAQHLVNTGVEAYENGAWWVELGNLTDGAHIPSAIAAALNIELEAGAQLHRLCRAIAPLRLLVVLDCAEHLLAETTLVAKELLDAAPNLRLLVTTQAPLRLAAERSYRLQPLAVPDVHLPAAQALGYAAVELFVKRAQAIDANFEFTDETAKSAIELCRHLDGLPLAIELAASRAPMLGVQFLAQSMQDRLRLLGGGQTRDAPARMQTLRSALDWSHSLLRERERVLFRRLAVFVGGLSLDLMRTVVPDEEGDFDEWAAVDALSELVDRSFVVVEPARDDTRQRYRLLDTPRLYAQGLLAEAGETAVLQRRHALATAAQLDASLDVRFSGNMGVDRWFAGQTAEIENARAALEWARGSGETETELRLAVGLLEALPLALHPERLLLAERCQALVSADVALQLQCRAWLVLRGVWFNRNAKLSHQASLKAVQLARILPVDETQRFFLYRALCALVQSAPDMDGDTTMAAAVQEARAVEDATWPPHRLVLRARAEARLAAHQRRMTECVRWHRRVVELDHASGSATSLAVCDLIDAQLALGDVAGAVDEGEALVAALSGTREDLNLAYAQLNLVAALLAQGNLARAEGHAKASWGLAMRFELQPYWADYLALLVALSARPRRAATMVGFADAGYATREQARAPNERNAVERARTLAISALGETEYESLRSDGAVLIDDQIPALAFGEGDLS